MCFSPQEAVILDHIWRLSRKDGVSQGAPLGQTAADLKSLFPLSGIKLAHVYNPTNYIKSSIGSFSQVWLPVSVKT